MQLTLGPILFNWQPEIWRDFYFRIADEAPVDVVALGEVVCSKRAPFFIEEMPQVIDRLASAGKTVLLASYALVTHERERRQTVELAAIEGSLIEANDISCLQHLAGRPHAIGPLVNIYNEATALYFAGRGAGRICLPPELPIGAIAAIAAAAPDVIVETFAFGRIPLAISARCYHARLHKLTKDSCRFICAEDPDGLDVETLDGGKFLAINGVQTLSYACANLIGDIRDLTAAGVQALRLSPQHCDMVQVASAFRDALDGRIDAGDARQRLARQVPQMTFADGFIHGAPGADLLAKVSQKWTPVLG